MSFSNFGEEEAMMSDINMTPLVDVMLVLLIMFIITIPAINHAVNIDLPQATNAPDRVKPENIQLSIDGNEQLIWGKEPISHEQWLERVGLAAKQTPVPELHLRADRNVRYERVVQVMAESQREGIQKIGFITELEQ